MKSIVILLTDDESINEDIFLQTFNYLTKSKLKKIYIVGDKNLFDKIYKKIIKNFKFEFINISRNEKKINYLKKITEVGIELFREKKVKFLINLPLNKKEYLNKNFKGYTEFFSKHFDNKKNENMLLFSDSFSVCPLTTHIQIKSVDKEINKKKLKNAIINILKFYKTILKQKQIKIVVLGLNPHASMDLKSTNKDHDLILPVVTFFKKKGIDILGPVSADTAFKNTKDKIFIGMYHDQVLIPFKILNNFDGINITIGKNLIRISPDHGTAKELLKNKKLIDNRSFLKCIKFCEKYA